ncbi:MAG: redox-regulated ATPase YchF [Candidatus Terraquivivens tikiterensis]|uniref:Redox-regulated ATPase YchF n=1 Tax=Candidatus Terraquivivens tikiterensis TaxID=1980982 RepID=A0A2R7Y1G4_9ARCH|nr:MAG: redox-regulated ATPase YchF [Candidatus Terraquivivens tikiterensis]
MEITGIVGKANTGKSTLFSAMTLVPVQVANYPFTTIKPNVGITHLRIDCVCREFGVKDNPKNSLCINGVRLVPIQVIDCPGIVRGAHAGRGLGLQFLDEIRQASALIVVCDAAGATDADGRPVEPGTHDPVEDVRMVEEELAFWIAGMIEKDWRRICRAVENKQSTLVDELSNKLSGLGIAPSHIEQSILSLGINPNAPSKLGKNELLRLAMELRALSKPILVAANKVDIEGSEKGVERLRSAGYNVIPCSAEAERILRMAAEKGLVRYTPGDPCFEIVDSSKLTPQQKKTLEMIEARVLERWGSTGVQQLINVAYLEILGYIPVYPVEDADKLCDKHGNVLPDVYLLPKGSTARDLAYKIHSELGKGFLYAIDVRTKLRLGEKHQLKSGDVISIISTTKRG